MYKKLAPPIQGCEIFACGHNDEVL